MFWIICVVSGSYQNPLTFEAHKPVCLWALFLGISTISDALPTERLIEHPDTGHSWLPHDRIEQRHYLIPTS